VTTSVINLPLASVTHGAIKRRRVLLVDASDGKRELRSEALRSLGIDVDCACDISEARAWWRVDLYALVLVNLENDLGHWDDFCADVRVAIPRQKLAFLVGKPAYLAESPNMPDAPEVQMGGGLGITMAANVPEAIDPGGLSPLWGIMEASRRISAVRSASVARSLAISKRPSPPRDAEQRPSKRREATSLFAAEVRKQELHEEY